MYFPLQKLTDTAGVCTASVKGTEENLLALIKQFKSAGFEIKTSNLYFNNVLNESEADWRVNIRFVGFNRQSVLLNSEPIGSTCFATFEGFKEALTTLTEQLKGCNFNLKTSDFYPSYRQANHQMVSRLYVEFEAAKME